MAIASNRLRELRVRVGWVQSELARRAGLSRAAVSAIETGRVVPSVVAALGLAGALGTTVEAIFPPGGGAADGEWAWAPRGAGARYWLARVGSRLLRYPAEGTGVGVLPHDGPGVEGRGRRDGRTLVLAGCDPAVGLLADVVLRGHGFRLLPFLRSSRRALELLGAGLVHVAGVHLGEQVGGNEVVVREVLGSGYRLVHLARWEEGLALAPGLGVRTVKEAVGARLRWVVREEGSGARRCLDGILEGREAEPEGFGHTAFDHRGVAETIRTGWAQAGVCVQLTAEEAGLDFLSVRQEDYDLCYRAGDEADERVAALLDAVRSQDFRRQLAGLPGYDARHTGDLHLMEP